MECAMGLQEEVKTSSRFSDVAKAWLLIQHMKIKHILR